MELLKKVIASIEKIDYSLSDKTQKRMDNLTKPPGSLGRLEELAKQIVEITRIEKPRLKNKVIFTFAGDHGIAVEGVSAYPQAVTAQMVYNFINGGAGINVLARHVGARVVVADLGVASDLKPHKELVNKKVALGTRNILKGPAMSKEEAVKAIENGIEIFLNELPKGIDIAGTGEMGIANTASASAIAATILKKPIEELTGRGTGIDDIALKNKVAAITKALEINKPNPKDAIDVVSKVGGFEIAGLVGVILAAASKRVPVVIDGFISSAAALIAYTLEPKVKEYLIAAHCSVEKGHRAVLEYMGLKPILDLNMRLGEGTGAALAMNIIEASVKILLEMATFEAAGVSESL
ncbi:MAG: nicotinate-nucleotide--dimethylbenzimidazole phosphoribosyltransferase [Omnitrophica WOR_2 bacterium GWF2_43_52]|nr:MAG: nicotinate-nucleotide--dimethylbenzimidazole phosphoribosyltransferase [Omnitrophica WOR_2 bacterium GWC2_44_8]OGX22376.1 MAG: nicotinate-nucleotide--dimethylbenzimidazole phosphoribosyltransferase [Omnitrophica WOR_2 bacterium GWF2_43_52]HAH20790.1 nicotinate-nucleotide--dimethylbenzimidazole phosphoribosyltransferase [Candidatus Omnitrophota bacterium]HBG64459.1 nicotinate-nucleotide--dimethylbenzimidazole phosphoribosyltransferase [Candidatus Omnitrophota bacterium]